jgi:hypothetical protein
MDPTRETRRLEEALDLCDSHENRLALANEYLEVGRYDEAITLFNKSLQGHYKSDPDLRFGLAMARFKTGSHADAKELLDQLVKENLSSRNAQVHLYYARVLEEISENDSALLEYESLINYFPGQEAKCRYGLLLKKLGQLGKADDLFNRIIREVTRGPRYYRKTEAVWLETAKKNLSTSVK